MWLTFLDEFMAGTVVPQRFELLSEFTAQSQQGIKAEKHLLRYDILCACNTEHFIKNQLFKMPSVTYSTYRPVFIDTGRAKPMIHSALVATDARSRLISWISNSRQENDLNSPGFE